ncbi:hypothetical protein QEZ48_19685 [Aquamicrobium lusatiense]|uniref:hypothetical protein n=1 Tax=Aquamicrobium lusatiense TaxID=89772 RepID=UPI00245899DE|nr:hypothetical protein [Aquamicrobium lusatiense]MDH4993040.1 hypothetical protein [Aquamicrobium lusatiense]
MTGNELDEILASDDVQEITQEQQPETESTGQTRDEQGRFATKAEQPEQTQEQPEVTVDEPEPEQGKVPQQALHAARQKAKEASTEAEQLRQQIAQMQGQIQMLNQRQGAPQKIEEAPKPVDFWESPDGYLESKLSPFQQQIQQQREQFSKMLAMQSHGAETVDSAYNAFVEAARANPQAYAAEYQSIMASEHPYDALVSWHKRQETLRMVGNDPNAWLEAEMEKRLQDPAYQAKVLERIKGTAAVNSRSNPVTSLPPSLSRLPAGGNTAADDDVSDAGIFSHAMRS